MAWSPRSSPTGRLSIIGTIPCLTDIEVEEYNVRIEETGIQEIIVHANSEKPDKKNYESKEEYKKAKLRYEVICDSF